MYPVNELHVTPIDIIQPDVPSEAEEAVISEDEQRRMMYERIAQGNALAEAEDIAVRKWRGR